MPLNNLDTLVKTTPALAPNSMSGVRNQLRFWGMSNSTGNGRALPELQAKMGRYGLSAATNLAQLQQRASELQVGFQQGQAAVNAGVSEDNSNIQWQKFGIEKEASQDDILSIASRALVATKAIGETTRKVTSALGMEGVTTFLDKIPVIGRSKELKRTEKLQNLLLDAYTRKDLNSAAMFAKLSQQHEDYVKLLPTLKGSLAGILTPEKIDELLREPELLQRQADLTAEWDALMGVE